MTFSRREFLGARDGSAASAVERILAALPVPHSLREIGVERADLRQIADAAMADWFITRNPRPMTSTDALVELLEEAW
jgi:alcohol dehydrogenase class IV